MNALTEYHFEMKINKNLTKKSTLHFQKQVIHECQIWKWCSSLGSWWLPSHSLVLVELILSTMWSNVYQLRCSSVSLNNVGKYPQLCPSPTIGMVCGLVGISYQGDPLNVGGSIIVNTTIDNKLRVRKEFMTNGMELIISSKC